MKKKKHHTELELKKINTNQQLNLLKERIKDGFIPTPTRYFHFGLCLKCFY